jgi:hypothetical protein
MLRYWKGGRLQFEYSPEAGCAGKPALTQRGLRPFRISRNNRLRRPSPRSKRGKIIRVRPVAARFDLFTCAKPALERGTRNGRRLGRAALVFSDTLLGKHEDARAERELAAKPHLTEARECPTYIAPII